uniref:Uncharacterized protein n=1 Tax=Anopheles epiroticus TaxID=199890 RepID=A0A182PIK3_9DIPT
MSDPVSVPVGQVIPPPLIPLPSCHARAKQVQARLLNELTFPTSYIANCRLCLGTQFGSNSTTIIDEPLVSMMKRVFPFPVTNQIGLPMNVCTDCFQAVKTFVAFSDKVWEHQQKLQETLASMEYLQYHGISNNGIHQKPAEKEAQTPSISNIVIELMSGSEDEDADDSEPEMLIDADLQAKAFEDSGEQGQDPLLAPAVSKNPPLRTANRAGAIETPQKKIREEDGIIFIDCERNDSDVEEMPVIIAPSINKERLSSGSNKAQNTRKGPKPVYICSTCNETFEKHYQLMCHQKTHFMKECPLCKCSFKYSVIRDHIIKDHGVLKESNSQRK